MSNMWEKRLDLSVSRQEILDRINDEGQEVHDAMHWYFSGSFNKKCWFEIADEGRKLAEHLYREDLKNSVIEAIIDGVCGQASSGTVLAFAEMLGVDPYVLNYAMEDYIHHGRSEPVGIDGFVAFYSEAKKEVDDVVDAMGVK